MERFTSMFGALREGVGSFRSLPALHEQNIAAIESVTRSVEALRAELEQVRADVRRVQALSARSYEAQLDWQAQLSAIRSRPDYLEPWAAESPLVSVRVTTWNNAAVLCERALPSLVRQTHRNWEALVVGDALTDDTADRVAALRDPRIRFWNVPFRGPYPDQPIDFWHVAGTAPANEALREARGHWIATLDHDDEFDPEHLEALLEHARSTRAELVYGKARARDAATGTLLPLEYGEWPPRLHRFSIQASLYHAGLRGFEYDPYAYLAGEPGDWNLVRRMWDAGVRFSFVDRVVATYWINPKDEASRSWIASLVDEASSAS